MKYNETFYKHDMQVIFHFRTESPENLLDKA